MTKIALTAAAIVVATGSAFAAGSDHYGSNDANQPAVSVTAPAKVDNTFTASIRKPVEHNVVKSTSDAVQPESGQGIWGR
jgi:ABC-type glycerol-3-phosphate transport system substrate-binding protein